MSMDKNIYVLHEYTGRQDFRDIFWGDTSMTYLEGPYMEDDAVEKAKKLASRGYKVTLLKPFASFEREKPAVKVVRTDL